MHHVGPIPRRSGRPWKTERKALLGRHGPAAARALGTLAAAPLLALLAVLSAAGPLSAQQQPGRLLIDPGLSMRMGATDLLTADRVLSRVPDLVLPTRLGDEDGVLGKGAGILYRLARLALVDQVVPELDRVVLHEYFGHGARAREFGWPASYGIGAPPPLGDGGGHTAMDIPRAADVTVTQSLALSSAGMEANDVARDRLARRWVSSGDLTYQEAVRYLLARYDQLGYIYGSGTGEGDDVEAYAEALNAASGTTVSDPEYASGATFQKQAWVGLLDPLSLYALYGVLAAHVVDGRDTLGVPMLRVAGLRYLPALGYSLTPVGPEFHSVHRLRAGGRGLTVDLRLGDGRLGRTWGVSAATVDAWRSGRLGLDLRAALWDQPRFSLDGEAGSGSGPRPGGLLSVRARWRFGRPRAGLQLSGLILELGYKTRGYLRGERLDRGLVIRGGMGL